MSCRISYNCFLCIKFVNMYIFLLLTLWLFFIFFICQAEEVTPEAYFYVSSIMFYYTYYCNKQKNINMSLQVFIVFLTIPSVIYWFIYITHNCYFKLNPFEPIYLFIVMWLYFYSLIYLFSELLIFNRI